MANLYDENYYENGKKLGISGYDHYRWLPELTIPMCHEMVIQLGIHKDDTILDFGCAKGYLVKGFRCLNLAAFGVDISEYAISQSPADTKPFLTILKPDQNLNHVFSTKFDWIIAKDVLEHIRYEDLQPLLKSLRRIGNRLFAICPLGADKKYVILEYEQDSTHIIRENLDWWKTQFREAGFAIIKAQYKMPNIKTNWAHHELGNGFFLLE